MKNVLCILGCLMVLCGCSSKAVPDWTKTSYRQLESYKQNYLQGKSYLADISFNKAVEEIKSSGNLDLLAKAYLTQYALHVAVLEEFDDRDYRKLDEIDPHIDNVQFDALLKGDFNRIDEKGLPLQYRSFIAACKKGDRTDIEHSISAIENPLSRLIASGIAVKTKLHRETILETAVRTASEQGWKKALIVYLTALQDYHQSINEWHKADLIKKRLELIK